MSKSLFGLLTLLYLAAEGYHLFYGIQVLNQHKHNPEYPQDKLARYSVYLVFSLIPGLLTAIYGITLLMFKDDSKVLKRAGLFRLFALGYYIAMGHGVYRIAYDWYFEHHHNHRMMSYVFYHDYLIQWGMAFLYSFAFRGYTHTCGCSGGKEKKE